LVSRFSIQADHGPFELSLYTLRPVPLSPGRYLLPSRTPFFFPIQPGSPGTLGVVTPRTPNPSGISITNYPSLTFFRFGHLTKDNLSALQSGGYILMRPTDLPFRLLGKFRRAQRRGSRAMLLHRDAPPGSLSGFPDFRTLMPFLNLLG